MKHGDTIIMIEHAVLVTDLDSRMEQAVTILLRDGVDNIKQMAEEIAKIRADKDPDNVLAMTGNALQYEYIGPTGRTATATWLPVERYRWKLGNDITNRKMDINQYFKH